MIKKVCIIILGLPITIPMVLLYRSLDILNAIYFKGDSLSYKYRAFLVRLFNYLPKKEEMSEVERQRLEETVKEILDKEK